MGDVGVTRLVLLDSLEQLPGPGALPRPVVEVGEHVPQTEMVLSHATLAEPGHRRGSEKHDAFLELRGPAAADAAPPTPIRTGAAPERRS